MQQESFAVGRAGETIRGMIYRPSDGAAGGGSAGRVPAVLFFHGFTGQRMETGFMFVRMARMLVGMGMAAVTFDFRGSGESDGAFDQMLVSGEVGDAVRMLGWVRGLPFVDRSRVGVVGFSLGGLVAACAMARAEAVRGLVLMAPTTVDNMWRHAGQQMDAKPITYGPHTLHANFFTDMRTLDPVADVVKSPRPTLLVQGTADTAVTPAVSQHYVDALTRAHVPLEVEQIAGADHGFSLPVYRGRVVQVVTDFLGGILRKP